VLIATGLCLAGINKMNPRINLVCFTSIILIWLTWFVHIFGWSAGSPNHKLYMGKANGRNQVVI
ncbi:MAG: hypothetical protein IKQ80_10685, partial [Clostridia bacterium]|nr:hypothetical protein [Clostridia bacterium]